MRSSDFAGWENKDVAAGLLISGEELCSMARRLDVLYTLADSRV